MMSLNDSTLNNTDINFDLNWSGLFVIGCILIVISVVGNVLVLIAFSTDPALQTITNLWIMSLALTDLLLAVLVMPTSMAIDLFDGYWHLGPLVCDAFITMDILCCTCSIYHLALISLDRYLGIRYPFAYAQKRNKRGTILCIIATWIVCGLISTPRLAGWKSEHRSGKCRLENRSYMLFSSMVSFYLPVVVIICMYVSIWHATRQRLKRRLRTANTEHFFARAILESVKLAAVAPKNAFMTSTSPNLLNPPGLDKNEPLIVENRPRIVAFDVDCDVASDKSIHGDVEFTMGERRCSATECIVFQESRQQQQPTATSNERRQQERCFVAADKISTQCNVEFTISSGYTVESSGGNKSLTRQQSVLKQSSQDSYFCGPGIATQSYDEAELDGDGDSLLETVHRTRESHVNNKNYSYTHLSTDNAAREQQGSSSSTNVVGDSSHVTVISIVHSPPPKPDLLKVSNLTKIAGLGSSFQEDHSSDAEISVELRQDLNRKWSFQLDTPPAWRRGEDRKFSKFNAAATATAGLGTVRAVLRQRIASMAQSAINPSDSSDDDFHYSSDPDFDLTGKMVATPGPASRSDRFQISIGSSQTKRLRYRGDSMDDSSINQGWGSESALERLNPLSMHENCCHLGSIRNRGPFEPPITEAGPPIDNVIEETSLKRSPLCGCIEKKTSSQPDRWRRMGRMRFKNGGQKIDGQNYTRVQGSLASPFAGFTACCGKSKHEPLENARSEVSSKRSAQQPATATLSAPIEAKFCTDRSKHKPKARSASLGSQTPDNNNKVRTEERVDF